MNKIPMTVKGVERLSIELKKLKEIVRPKIIYAISEARKHGDLKENAEYHTAREEQAFCEKRIKEIEHRLYYAQVIDIKNIPYQDKVIFGSTIHVLNINVNKKFTFCIVGDDESDLKNGFISVHSPLARSLIGKKTLDIVLVNTPSGSVQYKILSIQYI